MTKLGIVTGFLLLQVWQGFGQHNQGFRIQAKIDGLTDGTIMCLIRNTENGGSDTLAQQSVNNNRFIFFGNLANVPDFYFIKIKGQDSYITLFLDNSNVRIEGVLEDWPTVQVSGSAAFDDYKMAINVLSLERAKITKIDQERKLALNNQDSIGYAELEIKREGAVESYYNVWKSFIANNSNSMYAPVLISKLTVMTAEEKKIAYIRLADRVKASFYGKKLASQLNLLSFSEKEMKPGNILSDFSFPSVNEGEHLSLYNIVSRSKLTLVDFWASWCVPCREENPVIKKVYDTYHARGFNILGVSLDKDANKWKQAIADDGLNWYHVSDLKGWNSDATTMFKLNSIPRSYLLDATGKILAVDLRGEDLFKQVNAYFNSQ